MAKRGKSPRAQVPLRIPEALRARIERAAKAGDKSMNSEILERLEQSFQFEIRIGGPGLSEMVEIMVSAMRQAGELSGYYETSEPKKRGKWMGLPFAFDQAAQAANAVLEIHRPPGKIVVPKRTYAEVTGLGEPEVDPKEAAHMSRRFANLGKMYAAHEAKQREERK